MRCGCSLFKELSLFRRELLPRGTWLFRDPNRCRTGRNDTFPMNDERKERQKRKSTHPAEIPFEQTLGLYSDSPARFPQNVASPSVRSSRRLLEGAAGEATLRCCPGRNPPESWSEEIGGGYACVEGCRAAMIFALGAQILCPTTILARRATTFESL